MRAKIDITNIGETLEVAEGALNGSLVVRHNVRADLVTDAVLVALAIEHGLTIHSADADFARFDEVAWINPL